MGSRSRIGRTVGGAAPAVESLEDRRLLAAAPIAVSSLTLVNATTDRDIGVFASGTTLDLGTGKPKISVRANTSGNVASVRFLLNGQPIRVESSKPFAVANNNGNDYFAWTPPTGSHTLTVVPYSQVNGTGTAGTARSVSFKVVNSQANPAPGQSISWQTGTNNPLKRAEGVGAVVDGKLYVMGGFDGRVMPKTKDRHIAVTRADVFDPRTNSWKRIADMPVAFNHATGVVVGKTIWFVGGYEGNHPGPATNKVWKYDTVANAWSRGPDLPVPRGAGGAALIGNTIYHVAGMEKTRTKSMSDVWALNLSNPGAGWVQKASIPTPRNHLGVAAVGGKLYAVGGQLAQEQAAVTLSTLEVYDPATNQWAKLKNVPGNRSHLTAGTFELNGKLVFLGGDTHHDNQVREVFGYNPATNAWSVLGYLPIARGAVVAGALPDGRIVTSTGNGPGVTANTWIGTLR